MSTAGLIPILLTAGTALAQPVDAHGGQLAQVTFRLGSARLPVADKVVRSLGRVATWGVQNPSGLIIVDGHADGRAISPANTQLSLARAQTIRAELERVGVNPDQIVIAAHGKPDATRRVVIWGTHGGENVAEKEV